MATREELMQAMRVIKGHCEGRKCNNLSCTIYEECQEYFSCEPSIWRLEDGEPNE